MSKEKAKSIIEQYLSHCQTSVDSGDDADLENLENAKSALRYIENAEPNKKQEVEVRREIHSMMDEYFGNKSDFYKSDTHKLLVDNATELVFVHGLGSIEALEIVSNVYCIASNEFGS